MLSKLKVDPQEGISAKSLQAREDAFGTNHKDPPTITPFCKLVWKALDDLMLKILIVCALLSIGIDVGFAEPQDRSHAWVEGFSILTAVAVVSLVSAWSDYKKEL